MKSTLPILIAEDDPSNRRLLQITLGRKGFDVVSVEDGEALLEAARKSRYHLIITDIRMPVLSGVDAVRALRRGESGELNRTTPIIALSARAFQEDRVRALDAGVDRYITKPYDLSELVAALDVESWRKTA